MISATNIWSLRTPFQHPCTNDRRDAEVGRSASPLRRGPHVGLSAHNLMWCNLTLMAVSASEGRNEQRVSEEETKGGSGGTQRRVGHSLPQEAEVPSIQALLELQAES